MSFVLCLCVSALPVLAETEDPLATDPSVSISTKQESIQAGEPLMLDVRLQFGISGGPEGSPRLQKGFHRDCHLRVRSEEAEETFKFTPLHRADFRQSPNDTSVYAATAMVLFNLDRRPESLVFAKPGAYRIAVVISPELPSNELTVAVTPPNADQAKVVGLLKVLDYAYVAGGLDETGEQNKRATQIYEQCPGAPLRPYFGTRLGIAQLETIKKLPPPLRYEETEQHSRALYLLENVNRLPTNCPLREEGLYHMNVLYGMLGKFDQALEINEKLAAEYPTGEFGASAKRSLPEMRQSLPVLREVFEKQKRRSQ